MIPVEAIERVIDDLETKRNEQWKFSLIPALSADLKWHVGATWAFDYAINELRRVLSDYAR